MRPVNRLRYSLVLMLIMILAFGTVSYAWLTLTNIKSIEGLGLNASTGNELEISIDGINYSSSLNTTELEDLFGDISLTQITSDDGINFQIGDPRKIGPVYPNQEYLSFDLYFRTTEAQHLVYLINNVSNEVSYDVSANGTYVVSRGAVWTNRVGFMNGPLTVDYVEAGTQDTYYASDSVRISFIEEVDETNNLDDRSTSELSSWIFDPSGDPTRGYGVQYGMYDYFVKVLRFYVGTPGDGPEVKYDLSEPDPHNPYVTYDLDSLVTTLQASDEEDENGEIYYKGKIKVNVWIEGWDADSFDAILTDRLKIQLQFKALAYVAGEET
eukprot:Anaeramoba_ignava/a90141_120.p3 GENE.a90141_120~~a90141_120.p3  ORF type:complete len:326 (-),score=25.22 a90141_120:7637-8614(-)